MQSLTANTLVESGHYYKTPGQNQLTKLTHLAAQQFMQQTGMVGPTIQIIDDVFHAPKEEWQSAPLEYPLTGYTHHVLESGLLGICSQIMQFLEKGKLVGGKNPDKKWWGGQAVVSHGKYTPLLMELALARYKHQLGFDSQVNVLGEALTDQQAKSAGFIKEAMPLLGMSTLKLQSVLVDASGNFSVQELI